jgi:hypothetical protein
MKVCSGGFILIYVDLAHVHVAGAGGTSLVAALQSGLAGFCKPGAAFSPDTVKEQEVLLKHSAVREKFSLLILAALDICVSAGCTVVSAGFYENQWNWNAVLRRPIG